MASAANPAGSWPGCKRVLAGVLAHPCRCWPDWGGSMCPRSLAGLPGGDSLLAMGRRPWLGLDIRLGQQIDYQSPPTPPRKLYTGRLPGAPPSGHSWSGPS